jgi:DNA adenine methylase
MEDSLMRTPLTYYGGKQRLAKTILGLIPEEHSIYCEPFAGGAAIFFAKAPSKVEVLNDTNGELINFYEVCKRDFTALEKEIAVSLHSRRQHEWAEVIYANPDRFDRIKRAWSIWMLANMSYDSQLDGKFKYCRKGQTTKTINHKRESFDVDYAVRLQNVQIECCDALRVIKSRDTKETFFYLDPPYVGADQGHYAGYTQHDFDMLLEKLESIKGKFILSSYRNKNLMEFSRRNGWHTVELKIVKVMTSQYKLKEKIEVLTANYPIEREIKDQ